MSSSSYNRKERNSYMKEYRKRHNADKFVQAEIALEEQKAMQLSLEIYNELREYYQYRALTAGESITLYYTGRHINMINVKEDCIAFLERHFPFEVAKYRQWPKVKNCKRDISRDHTWNYVCPSCQRHVAWGCWYFEQNFIMGQVLKICLKCCNYYQQNPTECICVFYNEYMKAYNEKGLDFAERCFRRYRDKGIVFDPNDLAMQNKAYDYREEYIKQIIGSPLEQSREEEKRNTFYMEGIRKEKYLTIERMRDILKYMKGDSYKDEDVYEYEDILEKDTEKYDDLSASILAEPQPDYSESNKHTTTLIKETETSQAETTKNTITHTKEGKKRKRNKEVDWNQDPNGKWL